MYSRHVSVLRNLRPFLAGISWLAVADLTGRATRVVTVVAMARGLDADGFAAAALAMALFEIARSLTQTGLSAAVVRSSDAALAVTNASGRLLNWLFACGVAGLFGGASWYAYLSSDVPHLGGLMAGLLPILLLYPCVALRVMNAQREQNMRGLALVSAFALIAENLGTAILLTLDAGLVAICVGKWLAALTWVSTALLVIKPPQYDFVCWKRIRSLLIYGLPVAATELLRSVRAQVDVLLASVFLATADVGAYAFARNAGVGISLSLQGVFHTALLPWVADEHRRGTPNRRLYGGVLLVSIGTAGLFLLQALVAPFYVPVLFGDAWSAMVSVVSILCLSAIPRLFTDTWGVVCRALGQPGREIRIVAAYCLFFSISLLLLGYLFAPRGAEAYALIVAVSFYIAAVMVFVNRRFV